LNDELSKKQAGQEVLVWFQSLKTTGGFGPVSKEILESGRRTFESDRVSDRQTLETIRSCYEQIGYVLDPHSAVGVTAAKRSLGRTGSHMPHISLSTAHPAKFSEAVKLALKHENSFDFEKRVLPPELIGLAQMEKRVTMVENSWETVREIVKKQVAEDMR
jgi:threonine synthase